MTDESTLQSSAAEVQRFVPAMRREVEKFRRGLSAHLEQVISTLPDPSGMAAHIQQLADGAKQLIEARFPGKSLPYLANGGSTPPTDVWMQAMAGLIEELQTKRPALTKGGRDRDWQQFSNQYKALAVHTQSVLDRTHKAAFDESVRQFKNAFRPKETWEGTLDLFAFPAADLSESDLREQVSGLPGLGPLWLSLGGRLAAAEAKLTLISGDRKSSQRLVLDAGPAVFPAILDLDRAGGFRTTSHLIAERVILELLASLPADQLVIRVFDPMRLGDSASFLYGLGDIAERVIGDKVKTTDREIEDLLQETEEHITRVTQKYLQGEHSSLTEYNIAAKMVTEPYRVLLLYGFPSGFRRDGRDDTDRLERLAKIIDGGRRAGVFTIIVPDSIGATGYRGVTSLPHFDDASILDATDVESLIGVESSDLTTTLRSAAIAGRVGTDSAKVEISWAPIVTDEEGQAERRRILLARVAENFKKSTGTVLRPGWVAGLGRAPFMTVAGEVRLTAQPYEPATWWHQSTTTAAVASIGQLGATSLAHLDFHSEGGGVGALIGGRPGSGKSVLMHALVMGLVTEYSPTELELYLIDFKQGVEFKRYADARLPHARAVAIEAEREFGVAVLEGMVAEMDRRGSVFKEGSSNYQKLDDYRRGSGSVMTRQIAIIDEFQKLFERDDKIAQQASHLIERVLREGRAFGIHLVLASQTIQGMQGLDRHVLSLIPTRIALRMGSGDSELILGESNTEAKELNRAGEGIINTKQGNPDANERFQATLWDDKAEREDQSTDVDVILDVLRRKADQAGITATPRVYAGSGCAVLDPEVLDGEALPIGLPVSLAPALSYRIRREGGANLLVVNESLGPIVATIIALTNSGQEVTIADFLPAEDEWSAVRQFLDNRGNISFVSRREVDDLVADLGAVVEERVEFDDFKNPARHLVLLGLHRARDLDPDNDYDETSVNSRLTRILRDGPEVGVHTYAWADRAGIVGRRLSHQALREFGLRLVGPCTAEDSQTLIDSDGAASLKPNQAVFDDHERGFQSRLLSYGLPSADSLSRLVR